MQFNKLFIVSILTAAALQSCSDQSDSLKAKKDKLQSYRNELSDLKSKINGLEEEIQQEDTLSTKDKSQLVSLKDVKQRTFKHFVEVRGKATSKKNVQVSPKRSGIIKKLHHTEGDTVKKGDLLVELDSETIETEIEQIQTNLNHARNLYQKQKNLWEKDIGSEVEYLQAKNRLNSLQKQLASAKTQLANTKIKSPIAGEIDEIYQNEGEMANPTKPLCRVINLNHMRVIANISESHLGKINKGDSVKVHFPNIGIKRTNRVTHVGRFIDPDSRTFKIEVKIDNPNGLIKPNVLATIRFTDYENPNALVIPTKLLQESEKGKFIYTSKQKDDRLKARKTNIKIGKSYNGFTEILDGLNKNDRLIVEGFRDVSDNEGIKLPN